MTQAEMILDYLRGHGSISQLEAAQELGCWRLGARIWDLRHEGHDIRREMVTRRNRYGVPVSFARYSLQEEHHA